MKPVTLNSSLEDLQTDEQRRFLDTVAQLRKCGLAADHSLPQLVVCGQQSAGKSSVLEALTEIPFPRNDNLCTRFATEIHLRRGVVDSLTIKIIPDEGRSAEMKARVKAFERSITNFDDLPEVMDAAMDAMGITDNDAGEAPEIPANAFSKDVLSIEIEGPTRPQLTLVDIPGLIETATRGVTREDVALVNEITHSYISKPRTICLAVVSASSDHATQKILEKVRDVDPKGNRTLGIITKPDRIEGSGSKKAYLDLARNRDIELKLGWHVLKNRTYEERDNTLAQRKASESKWFAESVFKELPAQNVGIDALRRRLSVLLFQLVKQELPKLRAELEQALDESRSALELMGDSRSTAEECKYFLTDFSMVYSQVCKAAVDGHYEGSYFHSVTDSDLDSTAPDTERRIRAIVQDLNLDFHDAVREFGHKYQIEGLSADESGDEGNDDNSKAVDEYSVLSQWLSKPINLTKAEALRWVRKQLKGSRGKELVGNFNPLLVGELFWDQSGKWLSFASAHADRVHDVCRSFLRALLEEQCPKDVQARVWDIIEDELKCRKQAADDELARIKKDLKDHPMNYNHYYTNNIVKLRRKQQSERLSKLAQESGETANPNEAQPPPTVSITEAIARLSASSNADMEAFACEEALFSMMSIYKVSLSLLTHHSHG
jgi:GTPase SAR1 family protein